MGLAHPSVCPIMRPRSRRRRLCAHVRWPRDRIGRCGACGSFLLGFHPPACIDAIPGHHGGEHPCHHPARPRYTCRISPSMRRPKHCSNICAKRTIDAWVHRYRIKVPLVPRGTRGAPPRFGPLPASPVRAVARPAFPQCRRPAPPMAHPRDWLTDPTQWPGRAPQRPGHCASATLGRGHAWVPVGRPGTLRRVGWAQSSQQPAPARHAASGPAVSPVGARPRRGGDGIGSHVAGPASMEEVVTRMVGDAVPAQPRRARAGRLPPTPPGVCGCVGPCAARAGGPRRR
jgi:hypothetical protein